MTEDELLRELFPNALKSALMRGSRKAALATLVSSVKCIAAAFNQPVEAVAEIITLTEGITREELLEALHDESAT